MSNRYKYVCVCTVHVRLSVRFTKLLYIQWGRPDSPTPR